MTFLKMLHSMDVFGSVTALFIPLWKFSFFHMCWTLHIFWYAHNFVCKCVFHCICI